MNQNLQELELHVMPSPYDETHVTVEQKSKPLPHWILYIYIFFVIFIFFGIYAPVALGIVVKNEDNTICSVATVMTDVFCDRNKCYQDSCEFQDLDCKLVNFKIEWDPSCEWETQIIVPTRTAYALVDDFISDLQCSHSKVIGKCFRPYPNERGEYQKDNAIILLIALPTSISFIFLFFVIVTPCWYYYIYKFVNKQQESLK